MANLQEVIEQINQNPPDLDKPVGGPPPVEQPKNQTPPANQPPAPNPEVPKVPEPPAAQPKPGEKPIDPKAATQPENNTATPPAPKEGEQPTPPVKTEDIPDTAFYGRLSKVTDGAIKSEQDFVGLINHYNELLEQAEKGFQPKFKDERAKLAYQIVTENEGREPEAAMRVLRAASFNPQGKSPKEVLFEAYLIDPNNSDLSPSKAQEYFEAEYEQKYGDLEGNLVKERALAKEVRDATKLIDDVSKSFKAAEQPAQQTQQISAQVENSIKEAVQNFGGVKLAFSDNPQESEFLSIAIDDPKELEALQKDSLNPQGWWNDFMSGFTNDQGQFDKNSFKAFVREFWEMRNHAKKAELAYNHGFKLGQLAKINEARNASSPKDLGQTPQPVAPASAPKSFVEAWSKAAGVA